MLTVQNVLCNLEPKLRIDLTLQLNNKELLFTVMRVGSLAGGGASVEPAVQRVLRGRLGPLHGGHGGLRALALRGVYCQVGL